MKKLIFFFIVLASIIPAKAQNTQTLNSPDKNLAFHFYQKQDHGSLQMFYTVSCKDKPVINESLLDIRVAVHLTNIVNNPDEFCKDLRIDKVLTGSKDSTWKPLYGERNTIRDNYNSMDIYLSKEGRGTSFVLQVRAYNEGIAFRYYFPESPEFVNVLAENTEFSFPEGTQAWVTNWAQGPYMQVPLKGWDKPVERPMPLLLSNGLYACLAEAQRTDYSTTYFNLHPSKPNTIITQMYGPADMLTASSSTWRVIMVAEKPGQLIENNFIIQNLNEPSKIADASWIKPGKIMRETTLTTDGALGCIDFAAAHNLQYIRSGSNLFFRCKESSGSH